ncbi:hypothetical protein NliqN6_5041 [Naganishia liquefaciens]|uniref:Phospholipid-transporting ATPase n=1 Tax=Naganishia liquefaciens TaxID=104408 RepID=A0A8H3TYQ5_9TREE|nr:hypothetical protein NliqN6_5041 [Naganishia liquefaciens]
MSRRSANLSRFGGTSQSAEGGYGQPDVDNGAYPLRPLSRNRASRTSGTAAGSAGEFVGAANEDSSLRTTIRIPQQNGSERRKTNSRRKSRLSDADQEDGYLSAGTGDGQEEQDQLLLATAGVEGAWPLEHPKQRQDETNASLNESTASHFAWRQKPASTNKARTLPFGPGVKVNASIFPPNVIRNQKYTVISFFPLVFYEQFKFFFNLYFLLVALSQFVPALKIGFIATYVAPLAFVLCVTMGKEAYDDYQRHLRDKETNSFRYSILDRTARPEDIHGLENDDSSLLTKAIPASRIKAGDLVVLEKNMRVPADMVLLKAMETSPACDMTLVDRSAGDSSNRGDDFDKTPDVVIANEGDEGGSCFVRTDQLDGETDWKLKVAVTKTQTLSNRELLHLQGELYADSPIKDIHTFLGTLTLNSASSQSEAVPLNAENVLWANTVLASGTAVGMVVYTGRETRAAMNTSEPETKTGLLDLEINRIAKTLCTVTFLLSLMLVAFNGFRGQWYIYVFRFLILFSSIIPISLRVNLDMGKTVYAHQIQTDQEIPGTVVRTSTLPEELGRIEYLLSDKTGTLTQNEMEMKKLHMGTMSYGWDAMDEIARQIGIAFSDGLTGGRAQGSFSAGMSSANGRGRRDISSRVRDAVQALAVCHNVTPVQNDDGSVAYQASSPDEVAIVKWTEAMGITLVARDRKRMTLRDPTGRLHEFHILAIFPFTSESKRMGIIVRDCGSGDILFVQKGADVVMTKIVQKNDWLDEECGNMAREGLRTLVLGRKRLTAEQYRLFDLRYTQAQLSSSNRNEAVAAVIASELELELEVLALTGVEDKLQEDVKPTLELLRNAGLKIWMLTGDKIETATCIAMSSKLVARGQYIHQVSKIKSPQQAMDMLDFVRTKLECCLVIDGESLQLCLDYCKHAFIEIATQLPVVVACRCSPTQKADVARLIRQYTNKRVCCIGDGGNDVSMIQAADVGIGIVGKEGKQASLAADFSIDQFSFLTKLLLWHGRNSYKRSAKLAQFVIHRGLIISVIQAVFSSIFFFAPIAVYQGWLQVGYATLYTMAPVFSLVLDKDVSEDLALLYPELYKEMTKGRALSTRTFFEWLTISVYQGGIIMILSLLFFETEFINIVAISYTALVLNELIMVALEITRWHQYMILAELATLSLYIGSMVLLPEYFDLSFVMSRRFLFKVGVIVAISSFPLYAIKAVRSRFAPAAYVKVMG